MGTALDYNWLGFRELVGRYERFLAAAEELSVAAFEKEAQGLLAHLYCEGVILSASGDYYAETGGDEAWAARDEESNPEFDRWFVSWQLNERRLSAYLGERDVFYHAGDPERLECLATSMSDALADVLCDLQAGASHFDAGRVPEAMWEWTFRFDHWGDHALDALKALHSRALLWDMDAEDS